jgi:Xaa-Pro aminopeptidase
MRLESAGRVARLQAAMAADGLDALLLTHPDNVRYVTGGYAADVLWSSPTRILAAIVPRDGDPALLVPDFIARSAAAASGWARIETYSSLAEQPVGQLAGLLGPARRIGIESGGEGRIGMSLATLDGLRGAVGSRAALVDAMAVVHRVRAVKSDWELERLRWACAASSAGFVAAFSVPREGALETDVAREILGAGIAAGSGWPEAATMPGWVGMTSGPGAYDRFVEAPRRRALGAGDMLWSDVGFRVDGYWSDFCRAGVVGGPTPQQNDRHARVLAATAAGIAACVPGATAADVARATGAELERQGLPGLGFGRVGHGIGLTATEPPSIALHDSTVLEAGMVVTVEPAAALDDGLYCAEQVVIVRPAGEPPEVISLAPTGLATI